MTSIDAPITEHLKRLGDGDRDAFDDLLPLVYEELSRIARLQRRSDHRKDPTLNTTALIHEAYLRLAQQERNLYQHRAHFYAVAASAMRHIVIDEARKRTRQKRGGGAKAVSLDSRQIAIDDQAEFLVALDTALERLAKRDEKLRQVVECRFFSGLTEDETALALEMHPRTVRRHWSKAKAWLGVELGLVQ